MKGKFFQILETRFQKLIGYALLLLVVLMLVSIARNIGRIASIRSEVEKEKMKMEKIQKENEELERQIFETQGFEFIEKQLRDKLGLAKEGEVIVVLPDEETLRKLAPKVYEEQDVLPDPNWKKWLNLFF